MIVKFITLQVILNLIKIS